MTRRLALIAVLLAAAAALMFWSTAPSRQPRREERAVANTEQLHEPRGIEAPRAQPAEPAQAEAPTAPSAAEVEAAYEEDPTRFGTPRSAIVDGFIARAAPSAPAHERARAKTNAEAFFAALQGGENDLAALATQHGLTAVAELEIDANGPEPELAAAVLSRPIGHWTAVVPSNAGFTVLKVVKIREGQARPLSEVRDQVIAMLEGKRQLSEQRRILGELRAQAVIVQKQW